MREQTVQVRLGGKGNRAPTLRGLVDLQRILSRPSLPKRGDIDLINVYDIRVQAAFNLPRNWSEVCRALDGQHEHSGDYW